MKVFRKYFKNYNDNENFFISMGCSGQLINLDHYSKYGEKQLEMFPTGNWD